ncbi:TRAP transporter small permease [Nesterenkonia muleiensis]|uniref:TRAP transporter small permease n=1 Tax=Nesterenkonia muleiensis TaxID=2282648 RepID=UPI000E7319AF
MPKNLRYASRVGTIIWRFPDMLCVPLGLGIPIVMFTSVIARYTGLFSMPWSSEIIRIMILWLSFLGAAVGVRLRAHFRLGMLLDKGPRGLRYALEIINTIGFIGLGIGLVAFGWVMVDGLASQTTPVLGLSLGLAYSVVPVSGVWMTAYSLVEMVHHARNDKSSAAALPDDLDSL